MAFSLRYAPTCRRLNTMAVGSSLRRVVPLMPRTSAANRKLRRIGGFGVGATAAWLCLIGMGASQPPQHGDRFAASADSLASCKLKQKKPLFVGFAEGMHLDSFELSALAARDIVREVKHWACGDADNASIAVPSLQLAFARSAAIRLDVVQFDDPAMASAHVLLAESVGATNAEPNWRLDLTAQDAGWAVTQSRLATPEDIAEERVNRRGK